MEKIERLFFPDSAGESKDCGDNETLQFSVTSKLEKQCLLK
jgi:hypothetical protein